jgi:hypothetical protein
VYVNIIHSARRQGIRRTPVYFMTVTAKFSETERAIIKTRHLKEMWAAIAPGVLNFPDDRFFRGGSRLFMLAGIILFFAQQYTAGLYFFLTGIAMGILGRFLTRSERDSVSIKDLLSGPVIIRTHTPLSAREAHETVRISLHTLKNYIDGSETLINNETFEF